MRPFDPAPARPPPEPTQPARADSSAAEQIAQAVLAFEKFRTGHAPESVTVVLSEETLVVTLHGALSPVERALVNSPAGAAQIQELHRRLFDTSFDQLRQEIIRIVGVDVLQAASEVETGTGTVVKAFTTGTVVQIVLLAGKVPTSTWSGAAPLVR